MSSVAAARKRRRARDRARAASGFDVTSIVLDRHRTHGGPVEILGGVTPVEVFQDHDYPPPILAPPLVPSETLVLEVRRRAGGFGRRLQAAAHFVEHHEFPAVAGFSDPIRRAALFSARRRMIVASLHTDKVLEPGELGKARFTVSHGVLELHSFTFRHEHLTPSSRRRRPARSRR
jgi:hypothetical protein